MTEAQPPTSPTRSTSCPACGGAIVLHAPRAAAAYGCLRCAALVDVSGPAPKLLAPSESGPRREPAIPPGRRGALRGETIEALGYLRRRVEIEGERYEWSEYLLWNPRLGYRWLSEYEGHWLYLTPCVEMPRAVRGDAVFGGRTYKRFQDGVASVVCALGEFYWKVNKEEQVFYTDYIAPPFLLSEERTDDEVSWSAGEYVDAAAVWRTFQLPGNPPAPVGVAPAQPSPYASHLPSGMVSIGILAGLAMVQFGAGILCQNKRAHEESFACAADDAEKSRVSRDFQLDGRTSNIRMEIATDLTNQWAHFDCALIHEDSGRAIQFGREIGYFSGSEGGTFWQEGSRTDQVYVPSVPPGRWYLRIEPETPAASLRYVVRIDRDVPRWGLFFLLLPIGVLPYLVFLWRRRSFENSRWSGSDFDYRRALR
jgi:hypothetical protein